MDVSHELENPYLLHVYIFNMDISLIMALSCIKKCINIAEISLDESILNTTCHSSRGG